MLLCLTYVTDRIKFVVIHVIEAILKKSTRDNDILANFIDYIKVSRLYINALLPLDNRSKHASLVAKL
jgi:hypothetical protein